jgi:hypothetical protein
MYPDRAPRALRSALSPGTMSSSSVPCRGATRGAARLTDQIFRIAAAREGTPASAHALTEALIDIANEHKARIGGQSDGGRTRSVYVPLDLIIQKLSASEKKHLDRGDMLQILRSARRETKQALGGVPVAPEPRYRERG